MGSTLSPLRENSDCQFRRNEAVRGIAHGPEYLTLQGAVYRSHQGHHPFRLAHTQLLLAHICNRSCWTAAIHRPQAQAPTEQQTGRSHYLVLRLHSQTSHSRVHQDQKNIFL